MEKLYIPTTTLNFNNILSTESISPKSFYENRSFGYKRFEIVEPNRSNNTLIAYTKIPYFEINDNELDNYPLIIEISKDMIKDLNLNVIDKIHSIEVFQISQTIYLHPNKVKFLFLNEEHKRITLIKSEPSIETKLLPLYQTRMQIINKEDTFKWEEKYLEKNLEKNIDIKQHIYHDLIINKIKGFYFCYTLGEIYLNSIIKNNINKTLDNNKYKRQQAQENADYKAICKINEEENKHIEKVIKSSNVAVYKTLNLNNNKLTSFTPHNDSSELYKNIINDIIDFDRINSKEDFKIDRFELLKKIGDNFKESNFEGKDKSIEYIRNLMKNIKNYEPFEAESIDIKDYHFLLKSIAYYILKGDDLEKLLNTLKENNMKTFKMAFGLWGALFGFSAIPKTISNILFKEENNNIINIQDFLQHMYKKIHDFDIQDEIEIKFIKEKTFNNQSKRKENTQDNQSYNEIKTSNELSLCPICRADMIEKTVKKGNFQGYKFYGCSKYPQCKGKRNLEGDVLNDDFKPIKQSFIEKNIIKPMKNLFATSLNEEEILNKIYQYIKENTKNEMISKKIKISIIIEYLNAQQIKIPNTKRKFNKNKEIRILIKSDYRFKVIGKNPEYLEIKEN